MDAHYPTLTDFVKAHARDDIPSLLLRYRRKIDHDFLLLAAIQIEARRKTASKLPSFNAFGDFIYPSVLAAEQATAEEVSLFHAKLADDATTVLDMTAGLGIDAMTLERAGHKVTAIELDQERYRALALNNRTICEGRMEIVNADSIEWLRKSDRHFDIIFIDPARRSSTGARVYGFEDCQPDILKHMDMLLGHCRKLMIKASPMIDIDAIISQIPCVTEIYAVELKGECKEMLIVVDSKATKPAKLTAVRLSEGEEYTVRYNEIAEKPLCLNDEDVISKYLYSPSAAILKLGRHADLTGKFRGLHKCSANCQVYVSEKLFETFPGRILSIDRIVGKEKLKGQRYNIVCRDYPLTPEQLKKKLGTKDGGDNFLYGVRLNGKPALLECSPV